MNRVLLSIFTIGTIGLLSALIVVTNFSGLASAVTASDWRAGRIIDDVVFEDSTSMSVQDIQNFLNTKTRNGSCDKYGQRTLESDYWAPDYNGDGRTTHAEYAKYRGYGDNFRFTCLRDYYEVPKMAPNSALPTNNYGQYNSDGSPMVPAGAKSAAQLIYDSAQKYRISPKALLIKIATESAGPLTSDDWPFPKQYYYAMGAHCPDTPEGHVCDPDYAGFSIQLDEGASLIREYLNNMTQSWWPYKKPYQTNNILWQDVNVRDCGSGPVYIETKATAALYTYTPYQPNGAALQNMYGTGDGCSTYGNRNFWRTWNDWFGSTLGSLATSQLSITKDSANQIFTGKPVRVGFTVKNQSSSSYTFNTIGVAVRDPSGRNMDPGWDSNVTIKPWESYTYSKTFTPTVEGGYKIYLSSYSDQDGAWKECYLDNSQDTCYLPKIIQNPVKILNTPSIKQTSTGLMIESLRQNQSFTASYTIKNTSSQYSVNPGNIIMAGRTFDGKNRDIGIKAVGILVPGQTADFTGATTLNDAVGTKYNFYVSTTKDQGKTYEEQAFAADSGTKQVVSTTMKQGLSLIEGPTIASGEYVDSEVKVQFKVQNYGDKPVDLGRVGVIIRGPQGQNKDPLWARVDSLSNTKDGGIFTYSASFRPSASGDWTISYTQLSTDYSVWNTNYPLSEDASVKRSIVVPIKDATTLAEGPMVADNTLYANKPVDVTMKVKTVSDMPVDLGRIGVTVRGPQGQNKDPLWARVDNLSINTNGGIYTYRARFTPTVVGNWAIAYTRTAADFSWWDNLSPKSDNYTVKRAININVKPQATVTTGVALTGSTFGTQQASFTVTNHGDSLVDLGKVGLAVRDPDGLNRDAWWEEFSIPANSSRTHTVNVNFNKSGKWLFDITSFKDGKWSNTAIASEDDSIRRLLIVDVK